MDLRDRLSRYEKYITYNSRNHCTGFKYLDNSKILLEGLNYTTECIKSNDIDFDYKKLQSETIKNILWGLPWCLQDNSIITDERRNKGDVSYDEVAGTMLALRNTELIFQITKLNNELLCRIDLSANKRKLIANKLLTLPNDKCDIETIEKIGFLLIEFYLLPKDINLIIFSYISQDRCINKSKPMYVSSDGKLYERQRENVQHHKNHECECFCNCVKCWHTVCCTVNDI